MFPHRQPEWLIEMHGEVCRHYGERLFRVFDLRLSELREQYRAFLKAFYDIAGNPYFIKPPMDKVC